MNIWLPFIETGTGAEVYTRRLAAGLEGLGHHVQLDPVAHRYQYVPWAAPIRPADNTDVILANSWSAAAFARPNIPLVSVCHLVVHDPQLRPYKSAAQALFHAGFVRPMERRSIAKAQRNIAVSHMVERQMQSLLGAGSVDVIHNGVDVSFFAPHPVEASDQIQLLFVGKPSLRKGFDLVATIVDQLGNEAEFTCVGPEPDGSLPRPPGTYTGAVDRSAVRDAMQRADILLFPSRMEGFGLVAAEAMACGLPVVTCTGTPVEEFLPKEGGVLCHPDDVNGFVDGIRTLTRDTSAMAKARDLVREHAVEHLSEEIWLAKTEAVLQDALQSAR